MIEEDIPDIVETLRGCAEYSRQVEGDYYADQFATDASVFDDAADAIERLRAEVARLRLTDAEREAVEASREFWQVEADAFAEPRDQHYAAILRGLLERLG